jgi:hypothetical protein
MFGLTMGAVIGTVIGDKPEALVIGDLSDIQSSVGGCVEQVTVECGNTGDNTTFTLLGYVHDEGAISDPPLDMNIMASTIFNRELRGKCVIVSGTQGDDAESELDIYDLPSEFFNYLCTNMTRDIVTSVNMTQMFAIAMVAGVANDVITQAESDFVEAEIQKLGETDVTGTFDGISKESRAIMQKAMLGMIKGILTNEEEN